MSRHTEWPNKTLQPTATVLGSWRVDWSHNIVVAEASALPVAVAELGRSAPTTKSG